MLSTSNFTFASLKEKKILSDKKLKSFGFLNFSLNKKVDNSSIPFGVNVGLNYSGRANTSLFFSKFQFTQKISEKLKLNLEIFNMNKTTLEMNYLQVFNITE